MKIFLIVSAALVVFAVSLVAHAVDVYTGETEEELNAQMVVRCHYQMGEFGNAGVHACIQNERDARLALAGYPDELEGIVAQCYRTMRLAGWGKVKMCTDTDVAARDALASYATKYPDIVATCEEKLGKFGHNEVKQCADEQIAKQAQSGD